MSADDVKTLLQAGGASGVLIFILIAILRGWLIPRGVYDERVSDWQRERETLARDRDDWKEIALTGAQAAERAVGLAERRRRRYGELA